MKILVGEPENDLYPWKTSDGKFHGFLTSGFKLTDRDTGEEIDMPAAALLFVPKYSPNDRPSHNKYSPVIATASTVDELKPKMEAWLKENAGKTTWSLRTR